MSIISIGAKLIRDTKLGRVVTETVGDKIFTNFYTKGGQLAKQRVKQIVRTNVGNKSVITTKKVEQDSSKVRILQHDKVYDQNKSTFGIRDIEKTDNEKFVTKISKDGYIQDKYFEDGKIKRRCYSNEDDIDSRGRIIVRKTYYNNLGLPVPQEIEPQLDSFDNLTLKQMRKWAVDHNVVYAEKGSGLTFLNKTDDLGYLPNANEKLNNLDTYL